MWRWLRNSGYSVAGCVILIIGLVLIWPYMMYKIIFKPDEPLI